MHIKTNKDFSHVVISNFDIESLTIDELGELIKIGYQKSSTKKFYKKNVCVALVETVGEYLNRARIIAEPIFRRFEDISDDKRYVHDDDLIRVKFKREV